MKRSLALLLIVSLLVCYISLTPECKAAPSNTKLPNKTTTNSKNTFIRHYGPFKVGTQTPKTVNVDILTLERVDSAGYKEQTDISLTITANGGIVYRRNLAVTGDSFKYLAFQKNLPGGGSLLLLTCENYPSDPLASYSGQYFNFNHYGLLIPVTPIMGPDNNEYPLQEITSQGKKHLFVKTEQWTGNYTVFLFHQIELEGAGTENSVSFADTGYPVKIDENEVRRRRTDGQVTLYQYCVEDESYQTVFVNQKSKVTYLSAGETGEGQWGLHVKIEGKEGYVIKPEDLNTLGLFPAGRTWLSSYGMNSPF